MTRVRHKHSAAVFVVLMRGAEICLLRRKGTGWMDGLLSLPLRYVHALHSLTDGVDWVGHFFIATEWSGTPRLREPDRHSDLQWRSVGDLPHDMIPYVRQALLCIDRGVLYSEFGWPTSPDQPMTKGP